MDNRLDPSQWSPRVKTAVVILAIGHLSWTMVAVGGTAVDRGALPVDAEIVDVDTESGNVTHVTLRVTNHWDEPTTPVIRVVSQNWHIRNEWPVVDGDPHLEPGESATVTVVAPGARATPELPTRVLVIVQDQQRRATVGPTHLSNATLRERGWRT